MNPHYQQVKVQPRWGVDVELYSFFNLGVRWGWVVTAMPLPLYPQERPGNHCTGGWVGPRAALAPTGIRSPNRLRRSESLYRLSYRGPPTQQSHFFVTQLISRRFPNEHIHIKMRRTDHSYYLSLHFVPYKGILCRERKLHVFLKLGLVDQRR